MAKVNGIELKAIKEFEGMEGYGFSANIYMDGKKVGSVVDSAYGGCYSYSFNDREIKSSVSNRIKEYYNNGNEIDYMKLFNMTLSDYLKKKNNLPKVDPNDMFEMEDIFFYDLLKLSNREKAYKKSIKKGYTIMVILKGYHIKDTPVPRTQEFSCTEGYNYKKDINEFISKYPNGYATIYKSLSDFEK